jgi:hypothetical protein
MDAIGNTPRKPQSSAPCDGPPEPFKREGNPSVVLAKLYERLSRRGRRYFVGRVGAVKLLMVETGSVDRGSPVWQICCARQKHARCGRSASGIARDRRTSLSSPESSCIPSSGRSLGPSSTETLALR